MTKSPFGGAATGANPTDHSKKGTKRGLQTDGQGIPLAIVAAGANCHDKVLLEAFLKSVQVGWGEKGHPGDRAGGPPAPGGRAPADGVDARVRNCLVREPATSQAGSSTVPLAALAA